MGPEFPDHSHLPRLLSEAQNHQWRWKLLLTVATRLGLKLLEHGMGAFPRVLKILAIVLEEAEDSDKYSISTEQVAASTLAGLGKGS